MAALLSILSSLLVGSVLVFAPWTSLWDSNWLLQVWPDLRGFLLNAFTRGAVTGLGLVNVIAGYQVQVGFDLVTELLFKDNFAAQAVIITATSVLAVAGLSAIAIRFTRSGGLTKFLARRGVKREGPGVFVNVNEAMSPRAAAYQAQITGRNIGDVYLVDGVKFDGYKGGTLVDAKGPGYAKFVKDGGFRSWFSGASDLVDQAERQLSVAGQLPVTWHVAEAPAALAIRRLLESNGLGAIRVVHTPPF